LLIVAVQPVQSSLQKYSASPSPQIKSTIHAIPPIKGRFAIVTNVRRDAVDADGASDEGVLSADGEVVWSRRPDAGVKSAETGDDRPFGSDTPDSLMMVARKPGHQGEREGSR
jgi:hypothetical protein